LGTGDTYPPLDAGGEKFSLPGRLVELLTLPLLGRVLVIEAMLSKPSAGKIIGGDMGPRFAPEPHSWPWEFEWICVGVKLVVLVVV
jgi:hypothetical protein